MIRAVFACLIAQLFSSVPWAAGAPNLYRPGVPLIADGGESVTLQRWRGYPVVVTMEYSNCRFICSITLLRLKELQTVADRLGKAVEILVISVDPQHDTPEAWRQYRISRGLDRPNWHFLTASEADTRMLGRLLGIDYWYDDGHVMHDFRLVRLDGEGQIMRTVDTFDADVAALLD